MGQRLQKILFPKIDSYILSVHFKPNEDFKPKEDFKLDCKLSRFVNVLNTVLLEFTFQDERLENIGQCEAKLFPSRKLN